MIRYIFIWLSLLSLWAGAQGNTICLSKMSGHQLSDIRDQGFAAFKHSKYYEGKTAQYTVYPIFQCKSETPLQSTDFDTPERLLSLLCFERASRKRLVNDISWTVIKSGSDGFYQSDNRLFFRMDPSNSASGCKDKRSSVDWSYGFNILNFNGALTFFVREGVIHIYDMSRCLWMTLPEFRAAIENGSYEEPLFTRKDRD